MSLQVTDQQRQLGEALQRFVQREYAFDPRRAARDGGFDPRAWQALCELGLPALLVPEAHGGLQAPLADALHALQVLAPAALLEPVLTSCVLSTWLLAQAGGDAAAHWLPRLAQGAVASVAVFEPESGFEFARPACSARPQDDAWVLDGAKTLVLQGARSELLLVSARCPDGASAWFALPTATPGVSLRGYALLDARGAAELELKQVRVPAAARLPGDGAAQAEALRDVWLAALCAEAVGVMQACLDATVAYLNTRQQFGQPLARLQALQHRVAELWIELEQARSLAALAAARVESEPPPRRALLLAAAKSRVGRACREISQQSVQLHGGMGVSDELQLSHWFKQLSLAELWLGDSRQHLQRWADAMLPA